MIFAYADPPYVGQGKRYVERTEVDQCALVARLVADYPDGWALSLSSTSLQEILAYCPDDVRVGAWAKPFAIYKPNVNPAYAWEPVIFRGGRKRDRTEVTVRDWFKHNVTLKTGLVGAKPLVFCHWILSLLNFQLGDRLDDLYPGTKTMDIAVGQLNLLARSTTLTPRRPSHGEA
jgi:hypothetical protein